MAERVVLKHSLKQMLGPLAAEWYGHEGTAVLLRWLDTEMSELQLDWAERAFERESAHEWVVANAAALAVGETMGKIFNAINEINVQEKTDGDAEQVGDQSLF